MKPLSEQELAKRIWSYCNFQTKLIKSDVIIVLCSHDIRIARYASMLYHEGMAPLLIFSGGVNNFTSKIFPESEAETFANVARSLGVPDHSIMVEPDSKNTQENLEFTIQLLKENNQILSNVILVQNPNMIRRVFATATKLFPEIQFSVTSHPISFEEAPHEHRSKEMLIHELVGDLQRIKIYAEKGFITPQDIDVDTWQAFNYLVELGYTGNMIC